MNRVFASVDVSNLYYTTKIRYGNRKIDYSKLKSYFRGRGWCYKMIAYASEMNGKADVFFNRIRLLGFEVKTKPVKKYIDGDLVKQKADWDVGIAVDILQFIGFYDELILVCSDGDLIPAVEYCKERKVKVHVLSSIISKDLRESVDSFTEINESFLEK